MLVTQHARAAVCNEDPVTAVGVILCNQTKQPLQLQILSCGVLAGSKIRATSVMHMAWELLAILVGYQWLRLWHVRGAAELKGL